MTARSIGSQTDYRLLTTDFGLIPSVRIPQTLEWL